MSAATVLNDGQRSQHILIAFTENVIKIILSRHHTVFLLVLLSGLALTILAEMCVVASGNFSQLTVHCQLCWL